MESSASPVHWIGEIEGGYLEILDRRRHPEREVWLVISDAEDVLEGLLEGAIRDEAEIAAAVAFAVALAAREGEEPEVWCERLAEIDRLEEGEGEAVLERMRAVAEEHAEAPAEMRVERLFEEAFELLDDGGG